nr:immunoglobulin light chain junction region [Macaca mulatta]MOW61419.1 immunoglobulin light chain junction region [Macaca mulatta]
DYYCQSGDDNSNHDVF